MCSCRCVCVCACWYEFADVFVSILVSLSWSSRAGKLCVSYRVLCGESGSHRATFGAHTHLVKDAPHALVYHALNLNSHPPSQITPLKITLASSQLGLDNSFGAGEIQTDAKRAY